MNQSRSPIAEQTAKSGTRVLPNGPAAAAILSAGAGCAFIGIIALTADASRPVAKLLTFYLPTGPLSGVSSVAILLWLGMWLLLAKRWRVKNLALGKVNAAAFLLLALGILLTFPPFADFLQGK